MLEDVSGEIEWDVSGSMHRLWMGISCAFVTAFTITCPDCLQRNECIHTLNCVEIILVVVKFVRIHSRRASDTINS